MHQFQPALAFLAVAMVSTSPRVAARDEIRVEHFVSLPADVRHPEGLAVDSTTGELYVGTFDARDPASSRNNRLLRYRKDGRLLASRSFGQSPLTGLAFQDGKVYVLNFGLSKLQRLDARFNGATIVEDVVTFAALRPPAPTARIVRNPDGSSDRIEYGAAGFPGINGVAFDRQGDLWVSDSFQGAIYRIRDVARCSPCRTEVVSRDALLGTSAPLPFGANGLAFDADEANLYIANAGDNRLLRMRVSDGSVDVLAESVHGADGVVFHNGMIWTAANQADQVVAIDAMGRVQARIGRFQGMSTDGSPRGLLFPATAVPHGDWMVVTNLSLPITDRKGDEWEEETRVWSLARFRIPRGLATPASNGRDPD